jgi:hypothetical protein
MKNKTTPWISHLLFADDCLIFTQASGRGAESRLNAILDAYNKGSDQMVNQDKSTIFFGSNCKEEDKKEVFKYLKIEKGVLEEKYLGLPTALGRSTTEAFESICSKIQNLVSGWCEKKLSAASR